MTCHLSTDRYRLIIGEPEEESFEPKFGFDGVPSFGYFFFFLVFLFFIFLLLFERNP
jgi:hypothetical protein